MNIFSALISYSYSPFLDLPSFSWTLVNLIGFSRLGCWDSLTKSTICSISSSSFFKILIYHCLFMHGFALILRLVLLLQQQEEICIITFPGHVVHHSRESTAAVTRGSEYAEREGCCCSALSCLSFLSCLLFSLSVSLNLILKTP